jgi:iron complex transport system ATP-binding protein
MSGAEAALSFSDAGVRFVAQGRALPALAGVSADIARGQVTCIIGPNGAGKTSLLRLAAGLLPANEGSASLLGRPLSAWRRDELARRIAYLPQGGDAAWPIAVREIVALGRLPQGASLSRLSHTDRAAVSRAMERADVLQLADRRIDQLSTGERTRALFARALATEADILLADEPAAHLDPAHQLRLMHLMREEAERGAAVVVTLHELHLAAGCDRILVLKAGRLVASGSPAEALSDRILAEVFDVAAARAELPSGVAAPVPYALRG